MKNWTLNVSLTFPLTKLKINPASCTPEGYVPAESQTIEVPDEGNAETILTDRIKEEVNVTTRVEGEGGSISGSGETPYETVECGGTTEKEIIVTPEEGYEIDKITVNGVEQEFTADEEGKVQLEQFKNVQTDIEVVAYFKIKAIEPTEECTIEIVNSTTQKVTSTEAKVYYEFIYTGVIKDLKGDAKLKIEMTLPYTIDEENSVMEGTKTRMSLVGAPLNGEGEA